MSTLKKVLRYVGYAAIVILILGIIAFLLFKPPVVGIEDVGDWGEVSEDRIEVKTELRIKNPNPVGVSLSNVEADYKILANGVKMGGGNKSGISIPSGNSTREVRTHLLRDSLSDWWITHVRNNESSNFTIKTNVTIKGLISGSTQLPDQNQEINTDMMGSFEAMLNGTEGEYSALDTGTGVEPSVEIRNTSAAWGEVTESDTPIHMTFEIHNPNEYPIPLPSFAGNVTMNQVKMLDWESDEVEILNAQRDAVLQPRETREITYVVRMDNSKIDDWFASHVENDELTTVKSNVRLSISVQGTTLLIPQEAGIRCETEFQTAIMVDDTEPYTKFVGCGRGPFKAGLVSGS